MTGEHWNKLVNFIDNKKLDNPVSGFIAVFRPKKCLHNIYSAYFAVSGISRFVISSVILKSYSGYSYTGILSSVSPIE